MFEREIQKIKIILKPYFWESWFIKNNSFLLRLNHLWSNWMESMGFNHLCEHLMLKQIIMNKIVCTRVKICKTGAPLAGKTKVKLLIMQFLKIKASHKLMLK